MIKIILILALILFLIDESVIFFIYGTKLSPKSHFYNGWTHDHCVANLFLFTPDGQICAAYVNSPGTAHD